MQGKCLRVHAGIAGIADLWEELIPLVQGAALKAKAYIPTSSPVRRCRSLPFI